MSSHSRIAQLTSHLAPPPPHGGDIANPRSNLAAYTVPEEPLGSSYPIRIICLTNYEVVVYEKNSTVGGTWFENRYPGCKCDIPSHNYQFSWRPNPEWSSFFSPAKEIEEYLCRVCEEEGKGESIRTRHEVVFARWEEREGKWRVRVRSGTEEFEDSAQYLVDARGILNHWKWPAIQGLHDFQGDLVHSANWPENLDYSNKRVAIIGNGSSGIQIVPALQPDAHFESIAIGQPSYIDSRPLLTTVQP